jgi:hypothetical protein
MTDALEPLSDEALESTRAFAVLAQAYCELIQNHTSLNLIAFARECARQLALLYAAGLELSNVKTCRGLLRDNKRLELRESLNALESKLGSYSYYQQVYDPYEHEPPGVFNQWLIDDLHDIYRDLEKGLNSFELDTDCDVRKAIDIWRITQEYHWGQHATAALTALNSIIYHLSPKTNESEIDDD